MARGNQREKAREKNLKKQQQEKKKNEGDPRKRMEEHAKIMREKQKAGKCVFSKVSNNKILTIQLAEEKKQGK